MTVPVDRRSFVYFLAGIIPGYKLFPFHKFKWIKTKSSEVSHVMSVCTGAFLLAKAGLLDGLNATTTYGMENELAKSGTNIRVVYPERFVDAGKIITTAGLSSGIDGALHLVAKMIGTGAA